MRFARVYRLALLLGGVALLAFTCTDAFAIDPPTVGQVPWEIEWGAGESPEQIAAVLETARQLRRANVDEARRIPVRAVYLPAALTGNESHVASVIELVERTELNAVVVDVKSDYGDLIHPSGVALAATGSARPTVSDLKQLFDRFNQREIKVIARVVVFKDSRVPLVRPDWAVSTVSGAHWRDNIGSTWVDPHNTRMWDYIVDVSIEAALAGAFEIQYDYVRFPTDGDMGSARYPHSDGRPRMEVIGDFLAHAYRRLEPFEVLVSADVFGLVPTVRGDMGIGQQWDLLAQVTDVLSPMVYPSHYAAGSYGIANPNAQPYLTVLNSIQDGARRSDIDAVTIRPWLQDFSWGHHYGPDEVRAQIQAVYDAGSDGWMLWNSGGKYTEAALEPTGQ